MAVQISSIQNQKLLNFVQKYNEDNDEELNAEELKNIYNEIEKETSDCNFFGSARMVGSIFGGEITGAILGTVLTKKTSNVIFNIALGAIGGALTGFIGGCFWEGNHENKYTEFGQELRRLNQQG